MAAESFSKECLNYFKSSDFYEILEINKSVSPEEIKKAYRKLSLSIHPDRNPNDKENCTKKFQILSQIYSILSDKDRRALYDETGSIDEEGIKLPDEFNNWQDYWKLIFSPVSLEAITTFKSKYQESDEEKEDLKKMYISYSGDFSKIVKNHLLFELEDEERIRNIIQIMIDSKEVPAFRAFTHETSSKKAARKRYWMKERKDFEMECKKEKKATENDLEVQLLANQKDRLKASENFLDNLAEKYAKKSNRKTGKKKL